MTLRTCERLRTPEMSPRISSAGNKGLCLCQVSCPPIVTEWNYSHPLFSRLPAPTPRLQILVYTDAEPTCLLQYVLNILGLIGCGLDIGGKETEEELFEACDGPGFGCGLLVLLPEKRTTEIPLKKPVLYKSPCIYIKTPPFF
jgi:hypothetical protein